MLAIVALAAVGALPPFTLAAVGALPPFTPAFTLQYAPQISTPTAYRHLNTSSNGAGKLFEVLLDPSHAYTRPTQLVELEGEPGAVGEAYGELIGADADANYNIQIASRGESLVPVLDWLWRCSLKNFTDAAFLAELSGMGRGAARVGVENLEQKASRMVTAAALPEDSWNVARVVARQAAALNDTVACAAPGRAAHALLDEMRQLEQERARSGAEWRGAGHCDFFAAWGKRTEGGRLLASRNLDIGGDTGLSDRKLVTVYRLAGRVPYATFGFAGFAGALAGMSDAGIAVAEANLDNSNVGFNGQAWPLKLRAVLGGARSLAQARNVWGASGDNTAAFNFMLASAGAGARGSVDASPSAAVLETVSGLTATLFAGDEAEANATFRCLNGTVMDDVKCSWPDNGGGAVARVGAPLADAIFRSNHALHPRVMATQEPLWNDTVSRYFLLRDRLARFAGGGDGDATTALLTAERAVNITSLLGIKGPDYGRCDHANTGALKAGETAIVLSAVYDPARRDAYVAWEDGRGAEWRPASCATYQRLALGEWFAGTH